MKQLFLFKRRNQFKACAILFMFILVSVEFIHLFNFQARAETNILEFYCDAQFTGMVNGHSKYKADVHEVINFYFTLNDTVDYWIPMGDGNILSNHTGTSSPFSYNYTTEGFYNITLNAFGDTGTVSDWFILEIINDAPQFEIDLVTLDYYDATYSFEDDLLNSTPSGWLDFNNYSNFYIRNDTPSDLEMEYGVTLSGNYQDLRYEDNVSWVVDDNTSYRIKINFDISNGNEIQNGFIPGLYKLYFSANSSLSLYDSGIPFSRFSGTYANGLVVELFSPYLNFYSGYGVIPTTAIDWFKLIRIDQGVDVVHDDTEAHANVVKMEFANESYSCGMKNLFNTQNYGTIELWYKTADINAGTSFTLGESFGLSQKNGKWFIGTDDITPQINIVPSNDRWYHIRFDFRENNTIAYQNLSLASFTVTVDEKLSIEYPMGTGGLGVHEFKIESNTTAYIDAVGYTWENYTVGQNKISIFYDYYTEEEITFRTRDLQESALDTEGFIYHSGEINSTYRHIWDFADGTVLYKKSPKHQFVNPGIYPVSLTLIDDQGAMTTKTKQVHVINKVPTTWIAEGKNYDTTFDFKRDLTGEPPSGWNIHGDIEVIDYKEGFSKVIEIDNTEGGLGLMSYKQVDSLGDDIEFWIYFSNTSQDEFYFYAEDWQSSYDPSIAEPWPYTSQLIAGFGFDKGVWKWYYKPTGQWLNIINSPLYIPSDNEWVHIRLDFHSSWAFGLHVAHNTSSYQNKYSPYIDPNRIVIETKANSHIFLDSFGFTGDPDYNLGDNNPKETVKYSGTWDFRHIPDGDVTYDATLQLAALGPWIFTSNNFGQIAEDCAARIIPELDGHYKVLELYDNNPHDIIQASLLDFTAPTYGTIEFWLRTSDVSQGLAIAFGYEVFDSGIWLSNDGTWWRHTGQDKIKLYGLPSVKSNTWHHIRIDFDCRNSGGYLGLGEDQYYFWMDGIISNLGYPIDFRSDVSSLKWNIWGSEEEGVGYSIFLDAVGLTWDPAYNLGDNQIPLPTIYAGTELIFSGKYPEVSSYTEKLRFYWDFGDNQTARGQTVLHTYQTPGKYKVELTTIDSNGDQSFSEEYFIIDNYYPEIGLKTKFKQYIGNTTYDFDEDEIGKVPSGCGGEGVVFDSLGPFQNVVELRSLADHDIYLYGENYETSGTKELWFYVNDAIMTSFGVKYYIRDGTSYDLAGFGLNYLKTDLPVAIDSNYGDVLATPIVFEDNYALEANKWMHLRMDFCADGSNYSGLAEDTYKLYLDGHASQALPLSDSAYYQPDEVGDIFVTGAFDDPVYGLWKNEGQGGKAYIDNVGFTSDGNYTVGANLFSYKPVQFNEGDTMILEADSPDSPVDYAQLIYNWGPPTINVDNFNDLGWHYSHNFIDDDDGDGIEGSSLIVFVADPYYAWDFYSIPLLINNVLPSLNIHSPRVLANLSVSIYNSGTEGANFSVNLLSESLNRTENFFYPISSANFTGNWINGSLSSLELDTSFQWDMLVNQTYREGGQHLVLLTFSFENGLEIVKSFNFNGALTTWTFNLNEMWINSNNLSRVPLTFKGDVCDPSNDQITLLINYSILTEYEITYPGTPYTKLYTLGTPDDVICELKVYEEGGTHYAKFSFIERIDNVWDENLRSGNFPVSYNFEFDADMTNLNIDQIINNIITSESLTIVPSTFQRTHYINASYFEFNPSCQKQDLSIQYNISTDYLFPNIAPSIQINTPYSITEDENYTYRAVISDYNNDNLTVEYYFGINTEGQLGQRKHDGVYLGNNTYGVNYTYTNAGNYIITVIARDGITESKSIHLINIKNQVPFAKIRIQPNTTKEGEPISFYAEIFDTESDIDSLRYYWDFGDGAYSTELTPDHAYALSGDYHVTFFVKDDNGQSFTVEGDVTIVDAPPEILGPFSYSPIEGKSFLFDIDVMEGPKDFLMTYTWDIYEATRIYDASYNFMNVNDGAIPGNPFSGFDIVPGISYQVLNNLSGHIKVLELVDTSNLTQGEWQLKFGDNQSSNGTIEFWLRTSYLNINQTNFYINLLESGSGVVPIVISDNRTWVYSNNYNSSNVSEILNLPPFSSREWHHIRIDFECSNGSYNGLGENQWRIIVDGVSSPDLNFQFGMAPFNNASFLDTLQISSANLTEISIYCDAIGYYDGSSQYQIGANLYPVVISSDYLQTLTGERPSMVFDEGLYFVNLTVENELTANAQFSLDVINLPPVVTTSNRGYYGGPGNITITAYAWDSFVDSDLLEFEWFVDGERTLIESGTLSSTISVFCNSSGVTKGHVTVRDDLDFSSSMEFFIRKFLDNNGDSFTNEFEELNNISALNDSDQDMLPDGYEISVYHTDPLDPDSDDDGLLDGWVNQTQIGERLIGTDPNKNDTDYDDLLDGFEFFGWNVTIVRSDDVFHYYYSSDPLNSDTDNDGLLDGEEYIYRTNPRNPDTDNDNLNDFQEVHVYGTNPVLPDEDEDGLWDGLEVQIGTHFNKADTDGDGLNDPYEYYGYAGVRTNPLCKDSDHDFLSDSSEKIPISVKINGRKSVEKPVELLFSSDFKAAAEASISFVLAYSEQASASTLSDVNVKITQSESNLLIFSKDYVMNDTRRYISELFDLKAIIEENGQSYCGTYVLKVTYTNASHSDLCLEEYRIDITRPLNPNLNDYDGDGILDGVETQLLVEGTEVIDYSDLINITADTDPNTSTIYEVEISDIGVMDGAEIEFTIASNGTLGGSGSVAVEIVKRELDFRKTDSVVPTPWNDTFSSGGSFSKLYNKTLSSYFPNDYAGIYRIVIDIYDNNSTDVFSLIDISVSTDGYRLANSSETEAWITRPDKADTDGDGWSDHFEIYDLDEPTNPLAWDTDGDGVKDSEDINPLYDVVIQIEFVSGWFSEVPNWYAEWKGSPHLQMTASFDYGGDDKVFVSPHTRCTQNSKTIIYWLFGIPDGIEWRPRLTYYRKANFGHTYCLDIDDSSQTAIDVTFKLWDEGVGRIDQYWDTLWVETTKTFRTSDYAINGYMDVSATAHRSNKPYEATLVARITLKGLSRANTIAIYDNATVFNGHYATQERMHIIELTVTDYPSVGPFVHGLNYILIPSSVFVKTELASLTQNTTALKESVLKNGEFMSLDREDLPETASQNIESVFTIICDSSDASEILDLCLIGVINETANETGVINQYAEGFRAEMMNLHPDVLGILSVINPYTASGQGSLPRTAGEWWADLFEAIGEFLLDVFNAILGFVENIIRVAIDFIVSFVIKGAIFLIAWIWFGLTYLFVQAGYGLILPIFYLIGLFLSAPPVPSLNKCTITAPQWSFEFGFEFRSVYINFVGFEIPCVAVYYEINETDHYEMELNLFAALEAVEPDDFAFLQSLNIDIPEGAASDFCQGAADIMDLFSALMGIVTGLLVVSAATLLAAKVAEVPGIAAGVLSLASIFISGIMQKKWDMLLNKAYVWGMALGSGLVILANFIAFLHGGGAPAATTTEVFVGLFIGLLTEAIVGLTVEYFLGSTPIVIASVGLILATSAMIGAGVANEFLGDLSAVSRYAGWFMFFAFIMLIISLFIAVAP